jgi:hypothetical protein
VRTIKTKITQYGTENDRRTWDKWLPYLLMGYRMSNQAALGQYFPYYQMHGLQPLITGAAAKQLLGEPIDFNEPEQWVRSCEQRAQVLRRDMPLALGTLLAAQHRDQRRYEHVRRAEYQPRERKFAPGDLVYLRQQSADSIDVSVSRGAYKMHRVRANGRMVLLGADGTVFKEHMENCAPCHNPNIDSPSTPR